MIERQIPETPVDGKPLGRHIRHDPRSLRYPAEQATRIVSVYHASQGLPLTQVRGSCTAEALCGARDTQPNLEAPLLEQSDAERLYDLEIIAQGLDPNRDDPGGTGLDACQQAQKLGWITSYQHCFGLQQLLAALVIRPVMVGVNWYDSMDHPAPGGLVSVTAGAQVRGGHEFVADQIDIRNRLVWFYNSWSVSFGRRGRFNMSYTTLERLLSEQGDVIVPIR